MRIAGPHDSAAIASLRALWNGDAAAAAGFEGRVAAWLASEGDRRTTWLATLDGLPVGMASLFEYRRMPWPGRPDSRWGYVSNVFVRGDRRNGGIGSALLAALVAAAEKRAYARLVVSPTARSIPFYRRAGFVIASDPADADLLLVRPPAAGGR